MLNVTNFAQGSIYMLGALVDWGLLQDAGLGYWPALIIAPVLVGAFGILLERTMLSRLYRLDPLYNLLLTFGLALTVEGVFRDLYGAPGQSYPVPALLSGATTLGFMVLPNYRACVVLVSLLVCLAPWCLR